MPAAVFFVGSARFQRAVFGMLPKNQTPLG
jgi:hypothetical protein